MANEALLSDYLFLNTRPKKDNGELSRRLRAYGGSVVETPILGFEQVPLEANIVDKLEAEITPDDYLVFTSANGVGFFSEELVSLMRGACPKLAVIGEKTAEALKPMELVPDFQPEAANSEGFLKQFTLEIGEKRPRMFLVRGESATRNLPEGLLEAGFQVQELVVYRAIVQTVASDLLDYFLKATEKKLPIVVFYSGQTIKEFHKLVSQQELLGEFIAAPSVVIGPETAKVAKELGFKVCLRASRANTATLVEDFVKWSLSHSGSDQVAPT